MYLSGTYLSDYIYELDLNLDNSHIPIPLMGPWDIYKRGKVPVCPQRGVNIFYPRYYSRIHGDMSYDKFTPSPLSTDT